MADSNGGKRRITCKRPHPNPHIHDFLMSLREEAVKVNSSLLPNLEEAISSFAKYPLPITSAADCAILKGFNQKLCDYLESRITGQNKSKKNKVNKNGESSIQSEPDNGCANVNVNSVDIATSSNKSRKKNKNKTNNSTQKCLISTSRETEDNNQIIDTDPAPSTVKPKEKPLKESISISKSKTGKEKNNNTHKTKSANAETLPDPLNLGSINKRELHSNCDSPIIQYDGFKDPSELLGKWDSIPNNKSPKHKPPKDCQIDLTTFSSLQLANDMKIAGYQDNLKKIDNSPISNDTPLIDLIDDLETNLEYCQYDTKSTQYNDDNIQNCAHDNYEDSTSLCLQCSNITLAANAFEISFKEKMKKDTEEIEKCVLPRKLYLPGYRTPSYALLVALLEQRNECPYRMSLTKEELIQKAQKHTNQSFTKPEIDSFHTAWTHVSKLVIKGMIEIDSSTGEDYYQLTTMGRAVAIELMKEDTYVMGYQSSPHVPNDRVPVLENIVTPRPALVPPDEGENSEPVFIEMPTGTFEIVLLIDKHEHFVPSTSHKCKHELRSLTVGDFLWIARSKKTGQELVLPFIIERKRMDDLASSIKDGRFHEQKFRLRKSGIETVIYLIESHGKNKHVGLPLSTLKQALANTCVQDDFMVVTTDSTAHTFKFLATMSERLVHDILPNHLRGCNRDTQGKELMTFEYFNKASSKTKPLTVKETFIKMLLQLKGLSVEKALAITHKYASPISLIKAYDRCTEREGELLLANLKYNNFSKNVGPAISKTIYQLFSKMQL